MQNNNSDEDIKLALNKAAEMVKDLQPESIREKAFEMAFSQLTGSAAGNSSRDPVQFEPTPNREDSLGFFEKLQTETNLTVEELKSVYKLDKNGSIKIVVPLVGKAADKQRRLAHLYLLASKFGMEREWISALEFAKITDSYGINDGHTGKNLLADKVSIRQTGSRRGKEYMLTPNGVTKAKTILEDIIK